MGVEVNVLLPWVAMSAMVVVVLGVFFWKGR